MENQELTDIQTEADVKLLVDSFYDKVNDDQLLAPIFNDVAMVEWPHHLPNMYAFWNSLILGIPGYKGQPFPKHALLPITSEHFDRWLVHFYNTVDELFSGPNATIAKMKGASIAQTFQYKMGLL